MDQQVELSVCMCVYMITIYAFELTYMFCMQMAVFSLCVLKHSLRNK